MERAPIPKLNFSTSQLAISSHIEPHIAALGMFNVLNLSESIMFCSSSVGFQPKGTNPRRHLAESTVPNSTTTLQQEQGHQTQYIKSHKMSAKVREVW